MIGRFAHYVRSSSASAKWGLGLLLVILLAGLIVPALSGHGEARAAGAPLLPPSSTHLFGTDNLGFDVFTRSFAAVRLDLGLAVIGVAIPLVVGTFIGSYIAVTRFRIVRAIVMIIIDGLNAIPFIVLALALIAILGTGVTSLLVAISVSTWARYATLARTRAAALRDTDFVSGMKTLGYRQVRVVGRHILPNVFRESVAYGISDFAIVILMVASLSFLGAGVPPPAPEWGSMISDGRLYMQTAPWIVIGPGVLFVVTCFAVALLGEGKKHG